MLGGDRVSIFHCGAQCVKPRAINQGIPNKGKGSAALDCELRDSLFYEVSFMHCTSAPVLLKQTTVT